MRTRQPTCAAVIALALLSATTAAAQPSTVSEALPPGAAEHVGLDTLSAQMVDPTASLLAVSVSFQWLASFHGAPGNAENLRFRGVVPLEAFGYQTILQADVGYTLDGPGEAGAGLAPTRLSDWVVLPYAWGRIAVGAVISLEPAGMGVPRGADGRLMADDRGGLRLGPAVGVVTRRGRWTLGAINQNLFGGGQAVSLLQPVVACALSPTWTVGAGDLQIAYDWGDDELTSFPIGAQVDKLVVIAGQPLRLFAQPIYNLDRGAGQPAWTLVLGVGVLAAAAR